MTTQTYQDAAIHLLAQAEAELAAGDTRQASEKGWGAAAQAVKAVCERRDWPHDSHRLLFRAVARLVRESTDNEIQELFDTASSLHINFYENWLDEDIVAQGLARVQRLIEKLLADQRDQP